MSYRFEAPCLILQKDIPEWKCIEMLAELGGFKREEQIKEIVRKNNESNDELYDICRTCPNYPFDEDRLPSK